MLSINTISSAKGYYGDDNYYLEEEETAIKWQGKTVDHLVYEGQDFIKQFNDLSKGKVADVQLGKIDKNGTIKHHAGVDLTFSAPKSISIAALVFKDKRLIEAHDQAVTKTLSFIEKNYIISRFRKGQEIIPMNTRNMIAAKFRHDISRNKDPNLHTHATILNITLNNKIPRSIDNRHLYKHKMLLGAMYQAELALNCKKLNYNINTIHNNKSQDTIEIILNNKKAQEIFKKIQSDYSSRRKDILAFMKEEGLYGAKSAQKASLMTRRDKEKISYKEKQKVWNKILDISDKAIIQKEIQNINKIKNNTINLIKEDSNKFVKSAIEHLSEREAVFTKAELFKNTILLSYSKVSPQDILETINSYDKKKILLKSNITFYDKSGGRIKIEQEPAYTTPKALLQENHLLKILKEEKNNIQPIIKSKELNIPQNRQDLFTTGQLNACTGILTTKDRFINIQGLAGTGKTFMLAEVVDQAKSKGYEVFAMAPTTAAINVIKDDIKNADKIITLQRHLLDGLKPTDKSKLPKLWIVDESSFISTKQALALTKIAVKQNAQVVFMGDYKQLSSVDAGKPFAISQKNKIGIKTIEMKDIIRQEDVKLKQAVYAASKGDIEKSFESLAKNIIEIKRGNVSYQKDREKIIIEFYLSMTPKEREKTIVINPSNLGRKTINNAIKDGLKEEKIISGTSYQKKCLVAVDITKEHKKNAYKYNTNNIIRFFKDYTANNIKKGEYFNVKEINEKENLITLKNEKKEITWNPSIRSAGAEIFLQEDREIAKGDEIFWRRIGQNSDKTIRNANEKLEVVKCSEKSMTVLNKITNKKSVILNTKFQDQHYDFAYCITAHNAQGQTNKKAIIHLESNQPKLTAQDIFYVGISRAKNQSVIITDDINKLKQQLEINKGGKTSALEQLSQNISIDNVEDLFLKDKKQEAPTIKELDTQYNNSLKEKTEEYVKKLSNKEYIKYKDEYLKELSPLVKEVFEKKGVLFINNMVKHHIQENYINKENIIKDIQKMYKARNQTIAKAIQQKR